MREEIWLGDVSVDEFQPVRELLFSEVFGSGLAVIQKPQVVCRVLDLDAAEPMSSAGSMI